MNCHRPYAKYKGNQNKQKENVNLSNFRLFPLLFGLPSFLTGGLRQFNRETFFHLTPEFGHIFDKTISQPRVRERPFMPPAP